MNRLLDGKITVFLNRSSSQTPARLEYSSKMDGISFHWSNHGLSIAPSYRIIEGRTQYGSFFVSKDKGTLIKVDKKNYDSLFSALYEDCPLIELEIKKNPELTRFVNFMILVEIYNQDCLEVSGSN